METTFGKCFLRKIHKQFQNQKLYGHSGVILESFRRSFWSHSSHSIIIQQSFHHLSHSSNIQESFQSFLSHSIVIPVILESFRSHYKVLEHQLFESVTPEPAINFGSQSFACLVRRQQIIVFSKGV